MGPCGATNLYRGCAVKDTEQVGLTMKGGERQWDQE